MRQIVLDTETTGLRVEDGHRVIEIGCLEMVNRKLTGNQFHYYLNPECDVEAGALAVHGITNEFLSDKPIFTHIVDAFINFISGSELIIHNAPFDLSFLNNELMLTRQGFKPILHYCRVIDTLPIARQLHPGQRNSLDALCKRYGIDNAKRDLHGALLDANLLTQVYLAMTGGQGSFFDVMNESEAETKKKPETPTHALLQQYKLIVLQATAGELNEHKQYLELMKKLGRCIWPR